MEGIQLKKVTPYRNAQLLTYHKDTELDSMMLEIEYMYRCMYYKDTCSSSS